MRMTRDDFQIKIQLFRKASRLLGLVWLVLPFLIWVAFLLFRPFTTEVFAGWLTIMLVGLWAVLPVYVGSQIARRLGLFCPECGVRDHTWLFIVGVKRDGRCPRCKKAFLS